MKGIRKTISGIKTRREGIAINRGGIRLVLSMLFGLAVTLAGLPSIASAEVSVRADFNGDGFIDLAVGVPFKGVGSIGSAGAVSVIYGGPNGLSAAGDQFFHRNTPGINDSAEELDSFGTLVQ